MIWLFLGGNYIVLRAMKRSFSIIASDGYSFWREFFGFYLSHSLSFRIDLKKEKTFSIFRYEKVLAQITRALCMWNFLVGENCLEECETVKIYRRDGANLQCLQRAHHFLYFDP